MGTQLYAVRIARTGEYLTDTITARYVTLTAVRDDPGGWERRTAELIAATWIALTGDHDIEIEEA